MTRPGLFSDTPAAPTEAQSVVEAWNKMAERSGLPRVRLMTLGRAANLRKRIAQVGVNALLEAVARVEASPFCRGDNDRGWRADFDFILQARSLVKLLEHGYQYTRRDKHQESVNGAAILLAQMDAASPVIEGHAEEMPLLIHQRAGQ